MYVGEMGSPIMLDLVYMLVTVAFFGLMLACVRGCEQLGRDSTGEEERP